MTLLLTLLACGPAATDTGSGSDDAACGDPDGDGGDTGDIPNVLGKWTSLFATDFYKDGCSIADLDETSETWIGAFGLEGRVPDNISASFNKNPDEGFHAALDSRGGFTMTGNHQRADLVVYAQFGGLVYHDLALDKDVINGMGTLAFDADGDTFIDCYARGSWNAIHSGQ